MNDTVFVLCVGGIAVLLIWWSNSAKAKRAIKSPKRDANERKANAAGPGQPFLVRLSDVAPEFVTRQQKFRALTESLLEVTQKSLADDVAKYKLTIESIDWGEGRELGGADDEGSETYGAVKITRDQNPVFYLGFAYAFAEPPRPPDQVIPQIYLDRDRRNTTRREVQFIFAVATRTKGGAPWENLTIVSTTDLQDCSMLLYVARTWISAPRSGG